MMKIIRETAKAYLVSNDRGHFWVHKSLCDEGEDNTIERIYKKFKAEYIYLHPESIDGEDIDFSPSIQKPKVKVVPSQDLSAIPTKALEKIFIQDDSYREDVRAGYQGSYAEWSSKNIPF